MGLQVWPLELWKIQEQIWVPVTRDTDKHFPFPMGSRIFLLPPTLPTKGENEEDTLGSSARGCIHPFLGLTLKDGLCVTGWWPFPSDITVLPEGSEILETVVHPGQFTPTLTLTDKAVGDEPAE